jgi:DNA-binding NarL/FixJ family response regulator
VTDKGRVIIADDHGLFRQGLRRLLESEDYVVAAEAVSGDEALTSVAANPGCVLLLDISMPGMSGLEVTRRLNERGDDVRVVTLATPRSPGQIAAELYLSKKTVQNHVSAIYRKLAVRSRSEAAVKGMELHLIDAKG